MWTNAGRRIFHPPALRPPQRVWTNARDMELLSALRHQAPAVPAAVVAERPPPRAPAPHAADGWRARVELEEILTSVPGGSVSPPVIDRLLAWRERR